MSKSEFKVIIVGGSIGGLTLAHCLRSAGIDHIVLEKASDPAPQIGASIGILPNGARVLDQLGLYDEVEDHIEPLSTANIGYDDGSSFSSSYPKIINERLVLPSTHSSNGLVRRSQRGRTGSAFPLRFWTDKSCWIFCTEIIQIIV